MESKDEKKEKESCCGHRCCVGHAAFVLVLLLIGGLIGFGVGRCHFSRWGCPYPMNGPMTSAPMPAQK